MSKSQKAGYTRNGPLRQAGGIAVWVLLLIFVVGLGGLIYGLSSDASEPDFALLTVSFLFLMGISQAGVVFCAITRLVKAQWAKPYYRLAELSTLAFSPFAFLGFLLLYFWASDDMFYWLSAPPEEHLSPWLDIDWLLIRNLFGLALFYGLSFVYVRKGLRPDLGNDGGKDHRQIEGELYMLSPWVLLAFVVCNTFFAWDFAMMLIPHWHSTVFPIFFWFGNIFAGSAALIAFPAVLARPGSESRFGMDQVRSLGMLITGFTLMWLYFFWAQFFVIWFGNMPHESEPLWQQMYGHYAPYFWTMIAGCFFVPFVAFLFAIVKRSLLAMCVIALGINLGIWVSKYLMVVPVFSPDATPFGNVLDLVVAVGLLAGFVAVVLMLASRFPIYSNWEINLKPIPRR